MISGRNLFNLEYPKWYILVFPGLFILAFTITVIINLLNISRSREKTVSIIQERLTRNELEIYSLINQCSAINDSFSDKKLRLILMTKQNDILFSEYAGKESKYGEYSPVKDKAVDESYLASLMQAVNSTTIIIDDSSYLFFMSDLSNFKYSYAIVYKRIKHALIDEEQLLANFNDKTMCNWYYKIDSTFYIRSKKLDQ